MSSSNEYKNIIFALEPYDELTKTNYLPLSSKSYYVEEEGKFDSPKIISYNDWQFHKKNNNLHNLFYAFLELGTLKPIDEITNEKYFYVVRLTDSMFFIRNENIGFKCVSQNTINHVLKNQAKIILIYTDEGHIGLPKFGDYVQIIQKWCLELNLPKDSVTFITGNMVANDFLSIPISFQIKSLHNWDSLNNPENFNLSNFIPEETQYLYLNLNRSRYSHRALMLVNLLKENILDDGLNSFNYQEIDVGRFFKKYITNDELLAAASEKFNTISTRIIDYSYDNLGMSSIVNTKLYEKTFCSICTESHYENGILHFSEKIWKPILNGHPFFLLSSPNALKFLKNNGFKTFDNWFDESYDSEEDLYERVKIITKNLVRFSKYSINELQKIRSEMKSNVEHNYLHLKEIYKEKYFFQENNIFYSKKPHLDIMFNILKQWN